MNIDYIIKNMLVENGKPISDFKLIKEYIMEKKFNEQKILEFCTKYCEGNYPLQYLVECEYFLNRKIFVTPDVLIPRMETEEVVLRTVQEIKKNYTIHDEIHLLDLCTGSGVILIAIDDLLKEYNIIYYASDISEKALNLAQKNFEKYDMNVELYISDLFEKIPKGLKFDVIISNPPYVAKKGIIDENVQLYEPHIALFAENEGMYIYEQILANIKEYLAENYILCFEIGYDQGEKIKKIVKANNIPIKYDIIKDINNLNRIFLTVGGDGD